MSENNLASITAKKPPKKKIRGKPFQKGNKANINGRPKGSVDFIAEMKRAIRTIGKEKGISLIEHAIQKAYTNPQVLIAMLKKIVPDMTQSDVKINTVYNPYEKMSKEEILKDFERELKEYQSWTCGTESNPTKKS